MQIPQIPKCPFDLFSERQVSVLVLLLLKTVLYDSRPFLTYLSLVQDEV